MLFRSWRLPWAVLLAVPFAIAGALVFVLLRGMENDIYFQIGLVVLIGLAAKNAILIVEFAQQAYLAGMSPVDAAMQAARPPQSKPQTANFWILSASARSITSCPMAACSAILGAEPSRKRVGP